MTTYASHTLHLGPGTSFGASVSNGFCGLLLRRVGGLVVRQVRAKRVMITARSLFLISTWPVFVLMTQHPSALTVIGGTAVCRVLVGQRRPSLWSP